MPTRIPDLLQTGVTHHRAGRLGDAEAAYRAVLDVQAEHPDALYLLGVLTLQSQQPEAALALFERARNVRRDDPEIHNMCGEAYRASKKPAQAIPCYERALAIKPDHAGARNNLGNAYQECGRIDDAIASYRAAIAASPDFALAHHNLGIALKQRGRMEAAIAEFERAIAIMPGYAEAHSSLGNALLQVGRPRQAVQCHRQALAIAPSYAEAHSNLGTALHALGEVDAALEAYRQALTLKPDHAAAHCNIGVLHDESGRPQDAIAEYKKALAIAPSYAEAHNNLGNALDQLGRHDEAVAHYETAIALRPGYAEAHRNLTRIRPAASQLPALEVLLDQPSLAENDAMHTLFAIGNIHHASGAHDAAFEHFRRANALKRKTVEYDADVHSRFVDRLIAAYSQEHFEAHAAGKGSDSSLPVFVLGMPRSGTTLVEQILASHPRIHGAGELTTLARLERRIADRFEELGRYPESIARCESSMLTELADLYLTELRRHSTEASRITDKTPSNFLRIGLIKTLFPNAHIVHCVRDALDTCLSNYFHYFATGNEFSFDLGELGRYYRDYERLMAHWSSMFGSQIHTVGYEPLIRNQEEVSRRLIDALGLEWDEHCLSFYENERAVHTFSSMQVRKPIYATSVARWRVYEKHLGPLQAALGWR